jgi:hypothetical protein
MSWLNLLQVVVVVE